MLGQVVANQIVIDVDLLLFFEIVQRGGMMLGGVGEPLVTEDVQDGVLVVPAGGTNDAAQSGERNISTGPSRFLNLCKLENLWTSTYETFPGIIKLQ